MIKPTGIMTIKRVTLRLQKAFDILSPGVLE
jgi:hypothetical protein